MIFKIFGVLQLILIQIISAQISPRDLVIQNVLKYLEDTQLAGCSRSRRQINTPPVNLPGSGNYPGSGHLSGTEDFPVKEFNKALSFKNDRTFGNFAAGNGSPNHLALNNGLSRSTLNMGLPNNSPVSSLFNPFPNMNMPQNLNRLLPNGNNNNGLPINNIPNNFPSFNNLPNRLPGFNNVPNGFPSYNNIPKGLPGLDNIPSGFSIVNNSPSGLPGSNNLPNGLPGFNNVPNGFPSYNNIPKGLPGLDNIPSGFSIVNNSPSGLPGSNNLPNRLPSFNNLPNALPSSNNLPNGLPSFNNIPRGLPGINNTPSGLPSYNNLPNGLPSLNNLPKGLPSFNNVPNGLPGSNNIPTGLPGVNYIPSAMPGFNIMPNGLPNHYNLLGTNQLQNLINVPARNNILNSNNLPVANSLPNNNNVLNNSGLTNFNNFPCGIAYPVPIKSRMPLNNLQSGKILPSVNNKLPFLNNFRITEIGIGNGFADVNRFPRNDQPNSNVLSNANYLENVNRLVQPGSNELSNLNGFTVTNTPPITEVSNSAQANNWLSSVNNFPNINAVNNFAGEAENINTMQLNNAMGDDSNFQNYNVMPVNKQTFVNNIPLGNDFTAANTLVPNANSRLFNAINDGMPLSNGGYLNDILFANNAVNTQEAHVQNSDGNVFSNNDVEFSNIQVPVDWNYETVGTKQPDIQIILPDGVEMFRNVPSDNQAGLMANSLSLAQELIGNLQIEGLDNIQFLNGLPVAGITETVTVLNR